jgi:uncharacterized protein YejL (UPF0352 family)
MSEVVQGVEIARCADEEQALFAVTWVGNQPTNCCDQPVVTRQRSTISTAACDAVTSAVMDNRAQVMGDRAQVIGNRLHVTSLEVLHG